MVVKFTDLLRRAGRPWLRIDSRKTRQNMYFYLLRPSVRHKAQNVSRLRTTVFQANEFSSLSARQTPPNKVLGALGNANFVWRYRMCEQQALTSRQ